MRFRRLSVSSLFILPLLAFPAPALSAQVHVQSDTIVRYFERTNASNDDVTVAPFYEYLNIDYGNLESPGLSFHANGWGRHAFGGEFFEDRNAGEILYGYLQYACSTNNGLARLGRQYVFDGVSNTAVDGLRLSGDLTSYFTLSAYGGLPVSVDAVDGRSGDRIWGGRISHHFGALYDVGLSHKRVTNDGDVQRDTVAIDTSLNPPGPVSLSGYSARNLVDDRWAEHFYEAQIRLSKILVRPAFQRFDYGSLFETGKDTGSPFRFLAGTDETVAILGADATWTGTKSLDVGVRLKSYDYKLRDERATYAAGLVTLHGEKLTQAGLEAGRMEGDTKENRYTLLRGHFYCDRSPVSFSGDLVYARYDEEPSLNKNRSLYASLSAGKGFLGDALEVKLSGDYSNDPFFDRDVRGLLLVRYVLDK